MKIKKDSTRVTACIAGIAATVGMICSAQAVLVSYSFTSNDSLTGQTGTGVIGAAATDQWMTEFVGIDADGTTVDDIALTDVSGTVTVATLSHLGLRQHNATGQALATGNPTPLQSSVYMRHLNDNPYYLFEGLLPGSTADIVLFGTYQLTSTTRGSEFTIGASTLSTTGAGDRASLEDGRNYVFFDDVLVGPSGSITVDIAGNNTNFSDVNGFQIDFTPIPEPSVALLGGLGLLGLLRRRR